MTSSEISSNDLDAVTFGEVMALFVAGQPGPLERVKDYTLALAGAETNVAIGLSRLGHRTGWVGRVGAEPFGRFALAELSASGVDTSMISIDPCALTGFALKYGTIVSYDLNYRPSLWRAIGGQAKAQEVNQAIAPHVDVMIGNEEDFTASLGFDVEGVDEDLSTLAVEGFTSMIHTAAEAFPNSKVIGTTMRTVHSATINDWGALAWSPDTGVVQATHREGLEIMDRVGGGDSFASGLIYGLLDGQPLQTAVEYGAAHGALAMTTPGDTTMVTKAEVLKLAGGGGARVDR